MSNLFKKFKEWTHFIYVSISVISIIVASSISYGAMYQKVSASNSKIKENREMYNIGISDLKQEIKDSESRTREDIRELRSEIIKLVGRK